MIEEDIGFVGEVTRVDPTVLKVRTGAALGIAHVACGGCLRTAASLVLLACLWW